MSKRVHSVFNKQGERKGGWKQRQSRRDSLKTKQRKNVGRGEGEGKRYRMGRRMLDRKEQRNRGKEKRELVAKIRKRVSSKEEES